LLQTKLKENNIIVKGKNHNKNQAFNEVLKTMVVSKFEKVNSIHKANQNSTMVRARSNLFTSMPGSTEKSDRKTQISNQSQISKDKTVRSSKSA
jgi:hypothetical protein